MQPLCGSTQTTSGTIITIPANRIWQGVIALSIRDAGHGKGEISVQGGGTGAAPATGTVPLRLHCYSGSESLALPLTIITGTAAATLRYTGTSVEESTAMASGLLTKPGV